MDLSRAGEYFVRWWREEGGLIAASEAQALYQDSAASPASGEQSLQAEHPLTGTQGWGFDLEWEVRPDDLAPGVDSGTAVQGKMERCINDHMIQVEEEEMSEGNLSDTQKKKKMMIQEEKKKRKMKHLRRSS
jgi:hypothetical protein